MSISRKLISLMEDTWNAEKQDIPADNDIEEALPEDDGSGFSESDEIFGQLKTNLPQDEGLKNAISTADQFSDASDGQDTDIDLSFHDAFPSDDSGFEEDANLNCESPLDGEGVDIDPNTVPAIPNEDDQFTNVSDDDKMKVSDEELADDDIMDESTKWDDLF